MKHLLLCLITVFTVAATHGQQFHKRYGSPYFDRARKVIQTRDGNYLVVGETNGFGSAGNAFITKVDAQGSILWTKDYSGINPDDVRDIIELPDRNLVMCGLTYSYGMGGSDGYVMKTDSIGNFIWGKTYGSISGECFIKIHEDGEHGFYVAGIGAKSSTLGGIVLLRMDGGGTVAWGKLLTNWQALGDWLPVDITPLTSGGVVLCGASPSGYGATLWKFSPTGNLTWSKEYDTSPKGSGVVGFSVLENNKGEILVNYAFANSNTIAESVDNCILKLDASGNYISNTTYGGTYDDLCRTISNTGDGGVLICGYTNSAGNGDYDAALIKLLADGSVEWAKAYGTAWGENTASALQTADGGFILTGQTWSLGASADSSKIHLVKTDELGNSSCNAISWKPKVTAQSVTSGTPSTPIDLTFQEDRLAWRVNKRFFYTANNCEPSAVKFVSGNDSWSIYPNPFSSQAILQTEDVFKDATFTVFNALGQTIKEVKHVSGQTTILLRDDLPSGLYFIRLTEGNILISTKQLVIQD